MSRNFWNPEKKNKFGKITEMIFMIYGYILIIPFFF